MACDICKFTILCKKGESLLIMSTYPNIDAEVINKVRKSFYEEIVPITNPIFESNPYFLSLAYPFESVIRSWQAIEGNSVCFELNYRVFAIL